MPRVQRTYKRKCCNDQWWSYSWSSCSEHFPTTDSKTPYNNQKFNLHIQTFYSFSDGCASQYKSIKGPISDVSYGREDPIALGDNIKAINSDLEY